MRRKDSTQKTLESGEVFPLRKLFVPLLLIVTFLYALALNDKWRFQRDSAVYMGLGRSILEGRGYTFNYAPHTMYPPGLPVMVAGTGAIFGIPDELSDSFLAYNLLITLLGLGCIPLFYLILRELNLPPPVMAIAFLFLCFSRTLYYYSVHIMSDVPFTFFALAALLLGLLMLRWEGWKSWAACAGAALMIAIASNIRPVGPLLLPAVLGGLWLHRKAFGKWKGNLGKSVILFVLPAVPLILFIFWADSARPGGWKHYFHAKLNVGRFACFFRHFLGQFGNNLRALNDTLMGTDIARIVGLILALIMLVGLIRAFKNGERQLSLFALLLMAAIWAGGWSLGRRYLLPAIPVMYYWLASGGTAIGEFLKKRWAFWTPSRTRRLAYITIGLVVTVNLVRIGDVIIEQRGQFYSDIEEGKLASYKPVFAWLRKNGSGKETVVGGYERTIIHYFTRVKSRYLKRNTRHFTEAQALRWLRSVDFLVEDQTQPESTGGQKILTNDSPVILRQIDVGGTEQVKLLRVVFTNSP
ncbi:MAG: ArnT family glycosyltransferase [Candidatus Brocadiia bacterium]